MTTGIPVFVLLLAGLLLCVLVSWTTRRRRDGRDLRAAQKDLGSAQRIAGVFGLGEAPVGTHHRMGAAGQRRGRR